ncbi:MAG TPA: glycoside hydrolase family 3 C-terminal domain-containing protein [Bacteroidota bacterium]
MNSSNAPLLRLSLLTVVLATVLTLSAVRLAAQDGPRFPFEDTSRSIEKRVNDLVSRLTLDEKVAQMQNRAAAIPRLGIPEYNWWSECLHGVARNGIATVFPQAISMAATWDPELILREADVIATEARAKHNEDVLQDRRGIYQGLTFWSPNINIFRDPRWGRGQETYGEDPFLTSKIAVAFVKGLQGNDPRYLKVVSTPKHYAVHSGPEPLRHTFDAEVSKRDLYETYLPAFEACITEAGAWSVMGAYNSTLGVPCCASNFLLNDILRKRWGFEGYVVSDCGAIGDIFDGHKYAKSVAEASAFAVKAGCDLSCGGEYRSLLDAVRDGMISESAIDVAVKRLMTARFKLGMFDPQAAVPYAKIPITLNDTPEHDQLARKVAQEGIVLLKNSGNTLPLSKNLKSIAVIGPYADNTDVLLGNYNGLPSHPVTILQGIRNKVGHDTKITYVQGVVPMEHSLLFEDIRSQYMKPPQGYPGFGLLGEYFDNPDLRGKPVFTRIDTASHYYWDLGSPGPGIPEDHFSVRWTGKLVAPSSGSFEIAMTTDDKGRFYFNGGLLIDNWSPYEKNVRKTADITLEQGKEYDVRIEFAENTEYAGIDVRWLRREDNSEVGKGFVDAVNAARQSDAVVFVAGISPQLEGEEMDVELPGFKGGDRTSLDLPAYEEKLLRAVQETGKQVVLVLTNGSALAVNWANDNVSAILDAWYPGQEGGNAVADVVFGDYNPAGRLPVTFYKSVDDLPPFENYGMKGRTYRYFEGTPLYPFGYGLSYTRFDYRRIDPSKRVASEHDTVTFNVQIANAGNADGDEVVQLYVRKTDTAAGERMKSLKAFKRVHLRKGESTWIGIPLAIHDLRTYDEMKDDTIVRPGGYEIQIGASSSDIRLTSSIEVKQ